MKQLTTFFLFLVSTSVLQAQGLTHSAEGKSTIPIRGTAVGLDLAKSELSFGYNNINRVVERKPVKPIFGAEVRVKNEEGLGNLFSTGNLVPSGNATLYGSITVSDMFNLGGSINEAVKRREDRFAKRRDNLRTRLYNNLKSYIAREITNIPLGPARANARVKLLNFFAGLTNTEDYYNKIAGLTDPDPTVQQVYDNVIEYAKRRKEEFIVEKTIHIEKLQDLSNLFSTRNNQRLTLFVFGGISALGFKQFMGVDSTDLSNSFKSIDERGGNFGIGVNYQIRVLWLGLTFSRASTNNFALLNSKEYTLRKTTTLNPQTLIDEKKITGYSGTFGEVNLNNINADIVLRLNLDKEFSNFLLVNPYLRASINSSDKDLLPNKTNLGTGLYFLANDSKFLGGIYFELPDVKNNYEKLKPIEEQNLRPPFKRFSFGIVTKINLSSIMGW